MTLTFKLLLHAIFILGLLLFPTPCFELTAHNRIHRTKIYQ